MSSSVTLNQAAHVVAHASREQPADAVLRDYLAERSRMPAADKRTVVQAVFGFFRWQQWLEPRDSLPKQIAQALALQQRFDKNPLSFKAEALAALAVPGWLREEMDLPVDFLRQIQREPAISLRARPGTAEKLAAALGDCVAFSSARPAVLHSPEPSRGSEGGSTFNIQLSALRYAGIKDLFHTPEFRSGNFEIQDLSSQLVGHACAPQPGETWWDACAGAGGKTLHLADLMQNRGLVWASDRSARRLTTLRQRAARAKIFNYRTAAWDGSARLPTKTKFDGILLDAPCSGVGTWQRNPHARWTTTPDDVQELAAVQQSMLEHVVPALKPGGRLIYSVCTLTRSETVTVVESFTAAHPEMKLTALLDTAAAGAVTLWPHHINANGMFISGWRKMA